MVVELVRAYFGRYHRYDGKPVNVPDMEKPRILFVMNRCTQWIREGDMMLNTSVQCIRQLPSLDGTDEYLFEVMRMIWNHVPYPSGAMESLLEQYVEITKDIRKVTSMVVKHVMMTKKLDKFRKIFLSVNIEHVYDDPNLRDIMLYPKKYDTPNLAELDDRSYSIHQRQHIYFTLACIKRAVPRASRSEETIYMLMDTYSSIANRHVNEIAEEVDFDEWQEADVICMIHMLRTLTEMHKQNHRFWNTQISEPSSHARHMQFCMEAHIHARYVPVRPIDEDIFRGPLDDEDDGVIESRESLISHIRSYIDQLADSEQPIRRPAYLGEVDNWGIVALHDIDVATNERADAMRAFFAVLFEPYVYVPGKTFNDYCNIKLERRMTNDRTKYADPNVNVAFGVGPFRDRLYAFLGGPM